MTKVKKKKNIGHYFLVEMDQIDRNPVRKIKLGYKILSFNFL